MVTDPLRVVLRTGSSSHNLLGAISRPFPGERPNASLGVPPKLPRPFFCFSYFIPQLQHGQKVTD